MNDEARQSQDPYRAPQQRGVPPGPQAGMGRTDGNDSPEQRYANAVGAMNRIVSSLEYEALPWVMEVFQATIQLLGETDPARASVLNNLGTANQLMYLRTGDPADLEEAANRYHAATAAARPDDNDLVLYLGNMALAQTELANRTDDATLANDAVLTSRRALEQITLRDPRRVMALFRLGNALKARALLADDEAAEDESIDIFREVARHAEPADRVEPLTSLGSALLRRYERRGSMEDLNEGIEQLRAGLNGLADGEPRRIALSHLANAKRLRFERIGDLNDLQSAINELIGILELLDPGHRMTGKVIWGLCCAIAEHADCTNEPGALRRALRSIDPAVRQLATNDPDRSMAMAGYGAVLRRHFQHGAQESTLDVAVAAGEAAVRDTTNPNRRCSVLNSLATTLITRYEHSRDPADLDRAAGVATEATELAPAGSTPLHTAWAQLGVIALHRYQSAGRPSDADTGFEIPTGMQPGGMAMHWHRTNDRAEDLDTSIEMFEKTLSALPEDAPARASVANYLGLALRLLHQRIGRRRPYRWARKVLTEAAAQPTAPAEERLRAASMCGELAAQSHRWSEALDSFTTAVELIPLVTHGKRIVASSVAQRHWSMLAADAAACALECGEPEQAVELLEHGRVAVLADFLPTGSELGELHRKEPSLTDRAVRLRRLLDRPAQESLLGQFNNDESAERTRLANAWEMLLREVRVLPGYRDYLRRASFAELANSSEQGAVVVINLSRFRSDALVIFGGRVLTVPLPDASPESAAQQATAILAAVQEGEEHRLTEALDWLWETIARPVLDRMGYVHRPTSGERWPRLWWNVTGALSFVPLHAATARSGDSVLDRVVSSYTPTLRSLIRAQRRPLPEAGTGLVAAGSSEQISQELPISNQILAQRWPHAEVTSTESHDATEFARLLPYHPWVHICEPSAQWPSHPAAGILLDREAPNRPLGVVDLGPIPFDHAEFGYLGDCVTAVETPSASAVPLAGTLAFAGFTHVIGTLWEADEDTSVRVQSDVYGYLFDERGTHTDLSAHALHSAAVRLRDEFPDEPSRWGAHIHVGP